MCCHMLTLPHLFGSFPRAFVACSGTSNGESGSGRHFVRDALAEATAPRHTVQIARGVGRDAAVGSATVASPEKP